MIPSLVFGKRGKGGGGGGGGGLLYPTHCKGSEKDATQTTQHDKLGVPTTVPPVPGLVGYDTWEVRGKDTWIPNDYYPPSTRERTIQGLWLGLRAQAKGTTTTRKAENQGGEAQASWSQGV